MDRSSDCLISFCFMVHSEEKKQERCSVICLSQVSIATAYLTSHCFSLLQHWHGNNKLSYSHKLSHYFFMASVAQGGSCLHSKLHSWNCQEVYPKGRSMEKSWHSGEIWPRWQYTWPKGAMCNSASGRDVKYNGEKNPYPRYFLHNRWNQGEAGHLKTTERFFLGFMFGQGETLETNFSSSSEDFGFEAVVQLNTETEVLSHQHLVKGLRHFLACEAPRLVGTQIVTVPTQDDEFRLRDLQMGRRWLVQTQL